PGALDVPEKGQRMEGSGRTGGSALGPGRGGDARGIRPREIRRAEEGSSMLAARWHGQRDVRVEDIPEVGSPPEGWVKVKVAWCGLCGTDLEEYLHGPILIPTEPHPLSGRKAPLTMGHEISGQVVE